MSYSSSIQPISRQTLAGIAIWLLRGLTSSFDSKAGLIHGFELDSWSKKQQTKNIPH